MLGAGWQWRPHRGREVARNAVIWLSQLTLSGLSPAGRALISAIKGSWDTIRAEIWPAVSTFFKGPTDPMRILGLIRGVLDQIASAARTAGAKAFDELMSFLHQPDRKLGKYIGFVTGNFVFDAALTALTSGGYAAKPVVQRVARLFTQAATKMRQLLTEIAALYPRVTKVLRTVAEFAANNSAMRRITDALQRLFDHILDFLRMSYDVPGSQRPATTAGERVVDALVKFEKARDRYGLLPERADPARSRQVIDAALAELMPLTSAKTACALLGKSRTDPSTRQQTSVRTVPRPTPRPQRATRNPGR
jgi:hypothetical protein